MTPGPGSEIDLLITNGLVFGAGAATPTRQDIAVARGRIVAIGDDLTHLARSEQRAYPPRLGTQRIDADGAYVVPGLIDLHAHVFPHGSQLGAPASPIAGMSGVTTIVSAGDAGANTLGAFRELVIDRSFPRVLAFVNISSVGLASWPVSESVSMDLLDVDTTARAIERHRDVVVGVKVRIGDRVSGPHGLRPLERALQVGERVQLPVMVHVGTTKESVDDLLGMLRAGDIVTHCFVPGTMTSGGAVRASVHEARERGVLFDVGHGYGSFDFTTAEIFASEGFFPDTISTDLHSLSLGDNEIDLPSVMSKMIAVGMPLADVFAAVTGRAAAAIGRGENGPLQVGAVADLALIEEDRTPSTLRDCFGETRETSSRLRVRKTIRAGMGWDGPFPHAEGATYSGDPRLPGDACSP